MDTLPSAHPARAWDLAAGGTAAAAGALLFGVVDAAGLPPAWLLPPALLMAVGTAGATRWLVRTARDPGSLPEGSLVARWRDHDQESFRLGD